jgi:ribosome production factor 1
VPSDDLDVIQDETSDQFASYFREGVIPKLLITTSRIASKTSYEFAAELVDVFPNSQYIRRGKKFSIKQIIEFCTNREFTDVLVINEDRKVSSK